MKINRMWAMFYKDGVLYRPSIAPTRMDVVDGAKIHYGEEWPALAKRYGYTIEKVVVLRAEDFEELLRRAGE